MCGCSVAPLWEAVPPIGYGGTERVVSYLTEELVRRGHEVTLFASGDSQPRRARPAVAAASLTGASAVPRRRTRPNLGRVFGSAGRFDVIHFT